MTPNFNRHDAERLETLTQTVATWRKKTGLTVLDILTACRFILADKFEWEESIEAAVDTHGRWTAYYDTGRNESDARDRHIEKLEAEVAKAHAAISELIGAGDELKAELERLDSMRCKCGHSWLFHEDKEFPRTPWHRAGGKCEECDCQQYQADPNWEPADPPGWEGGFADNH